MTAATESQVDAWVKEWYGTIEGKETLEAQQRDPGGFDWTGFREWAEEQCAAERSPSHDLYDTIVAAFYPMAR